MKVRIIILLGCIFLISSISIAQSITAEQRQALIDSLNSGDLHICSWATEEIIRYKITEAVPILEEKIWSKPNVSFKLEFLRAIAILDSNNVASFAHTIIDSAGYYARASRSAFDDSLDTRAEATHRLIMRHDFSTVNYIFQILNRDWPRGVDVFALRSLEDVVLFVPGYADSANVWLGRIAISGPSSLGREVALSELEKISSPQLIEVLLITAVEDSDRGNRWLAILQLLKRNYSGSRGIIEERLQNDPDPRNRGAMAAILSNLNYDLWAQPTFGSPQDYKAIIDQYARETDTSAKTEMFLDLNYFEPPDLTDSLSLGSVIDTLIALNFRVAIYSWLGSQNFIDELDSSLANAKNYIGVRDSNNCSRQMRQFQQKVDNANKDTLHIHPDRVVTHEGWKFLYYNAQYILDRLPIPPSQFNLNINIHGNGSVTKSPDLALYDSASSVQLTAVPSPGYAFYGWSDSVAGAANPITLIMNSNKVVTATFYLNSFAITASSGTNGTISPSGSVNVNYGASQVFTITPNTGYHIDSVFIDNNYVGNSSPDTIKNVTANHTISAKFAINQYSITSSSGSNGTISPSGNVSVNYGGTQAFTITPSTGYHVDSLIVDGINQGQLTSYTFTNVTTNHTISAKFAIIHDTITASNGSNGTINPSGAVIVNYSANQTFTFTPNTGYYVDSLIVDGVRQTSASSYTFTNITANHTIRVTFSNQYTITTSVSGGGSILLSPNSPTYSYGASVRLSAKPQVNNAQIVVKPDMSNPGNWKFDHWELDVTGTTNPVTITVNGNKNVRAVFVPAN